MPPTKSFPLKFNTLAAIRARWRDVDRVGPGAAGDRRAGGQAGAAGPAAADVGARDRLPAGDADAFRRRSHQSHLQELLGPAAPGGGDAIQRPQAIRAVVGSARRLRPQLFVLLRRRRHRVLDLCARGADAAGLAAAGLCRRDPVRRRHQRAADGVRRALLHRRRRRRAGDVSGDLAGLWLHLPLAVDPAVRRRHRRRADAAGLARLPPACSAGAGAKRARRRRCERLHHVSRH